MSTRMAVLILVAAAVLIGGARQTVAQPRASVQVTFAELDDHGEWYKLPRVGWVWAPYADNEWRPFNYGHWSWTSDGWTWVSYEPFGWITCHYGHWYYDDDYGWLWVPGYDWSPAQVRWVVTDHEISWAPLPPPGRDIPAAYAPRASLYWTIVPTRYFTADEVYRHRVVVQTSVRQPKKRVLYKSAPKVEWVRKHTKVRVAPVKIQKTTTVAGERKLIKLRAPHRKTKPVVPVGVKFKGARRRPAGVETYKVRGKTHRPVTPAKTETRVRPAGNSVRPKKEVHYKAGHAEPGPRKSGVHVKPGVGHAKGHDKDGHPGVGHAKGHDKDGHPGVGHAKGHDKEGHPGVGHAKGHHKVRNEPPGQAVSGEKRGHGASKRKEARAREKDEREDEREREKDEREQEKGKSNQGKGHNRRK